jgi:hypothetical protein
MNPLTLHAIAEATRRIKERQAAERAAKEKESEK